MVDILLTVTQRKPNLSAPSKKEPATSLAPLFYSLLNFSSVR